MVKRNIKFSKYDIQISIKKGKYNKVKGRRDREKDNLRLYQIENYMREFFLLLKYEYIELVENKTKHIRIDFIEKICLQRKWIMENEYLRIIH
jgi:hypothetical protein